VNRATAVEAAPTADEQDAVSPQPRRGFTRRRFLGLTGASMAGLALYAGEISRHELSVEEHTIHLARLPDAFRGMRIVQASDFHYAEYTEPFFLREMVRKINRLRPDMVVLTGDFISFAPLSASFARRCALACAEILGGIECPLRYASLGNHDYFIKPHNVAGPLEEHGIRVLTNAATALERDGKRLWLAGLGSMCTGDSQPRRAIPRTAAREAVILLAHEPDILPEVAQYNVDLMLSGHTHGGQVRFPFLPPYHLPEFGQKYVEGWFRLGATQMYVNRGIGAVGLPFRFRCPPEITVITLG
jgi:predicted MPP superfamily phosphohydrolase